MMRMRNTMPEQPWERELVSKPFARSRFTEQHMRAIEQAVAGTRDIRGIRGIEGAGPGGWKRTRKLALPVMITAAILFSAIVIPPLWTGHSPFSPARPSGEQPGPAWPMASRFAGGQVKLGDVIAGLEVVGIDLSGDAESGGPYGSVVFAGQAQLTGTYRIERGTSGELRVGFVPAADAQGEPALPQILGDNRPLQLDLVNAAEAAVMLVAGSEGTEAGGKAGASAEFVTGTATIVIADYAIFYTEAGGDNQASLVAVKTATRDAAQPGDEDRARNEAEEGDALWGLFAKYDHPVKVYEAYDLEPLSNLSFEQVLPALEHSNAWVRWYAAYRISDFFSELGTVEMEQAVAALDKLQQEDSDGAVVAAARLSLALATKDTEFMAHDSRFAVQPRSADSADAPIFAYIKYAEAQFNEGRVRLWHDGSDATVLDGTGMTVHSLDWSPDGKWLAVAHGGNRSSFITLVESVWGSKLLLHELDWAGSLPTGHEAAGATLFNSWATVAGWSTDYRKLLLQFEAMTEQNEGISGYAVFDTRSMEFTKWYGESDAAPTDWSREGEEDREGT